MFFFLKKLLNQNNNLADSKQEQTAQKNLNVNKDNLKSSLIALYKKIITSSLNFWESVKQDELDYTKLTKLSSVTLINFEKINLLADKLNFKKQNDLKFLYLHAFFLKILFFQEKEFNQIIEIIKVSIRSVNDLQNEELHDFVRKDLSEYSVAMFIVDITMPDKNIIINANSAANKLFCVENSTLNKKELNFIIPEWLGDTHNKLITQYKSSNQRKKLT